ncbi:hypothetical protein [Loigolactobacillus jiayinensis]|uniref:Integral membrane protein n=1 Tax=Loigolactobacillus jiayinensis TaxID=2486016 RepID=A0ABW1REM2_9LACO|nr:hypothetical protein [Loigolactobacillus jiayinensis]
MFSHFIAAFIATFLPIIGYLFLLPFLLVLLLTYLNRSSKQMLVNQFGLQAQVYLGGLGIILHETSHLLTALLFHHKIIGFKLVVLPWHLNANSSEQALGYVQHASTKRLWPTLGNLFIGIAPIFGCTAAMYLSTYLLLPTTYQRLNAFIMAPTGDSLQWLLSSFGQAFSSFPLLLIWLLLMINITLGGFDLSSADFKNSASGVLPALLLVLVISCLLTFLGLSRSTTSLVKRAGLLIASWLILSVIISGLLNALLRLLRLAH